MPDRLRRGLEDVRDMALSNIKFMVGENEKAETKILSLREGIERNEREIAENEAAAAEATRLLEGA
jgi:hypothetical protein